MEEVLVSPRLVAKIESEEPTLRLAVHSDITALLSAGVLDRTEDGRIDFPFDAVKVEFVLETA